MANIAPAPVILEAGRGEVVDTLAHCYQAVLCFRDSKSMRSPLGLGGALLGR